ncbi:hypothetical protein C8F04DRAFT_89231 [Mycena alexandri]|uniref:DUF6534 domain-containing protein n=1 Tax=Mycena alexandri TaxID=1745969 RepID=A0AAD6WU78_9AGAR|nr:hypothetical protein C8F04DRAFT_89231 [Mycena alexandri]
MDPAAGPPPGFKFNPDNTLGAYQIGVLVSLVLFGVMSTQTYIYYGRFPNDTRNMKIMVAFVWILEFAQAICISIALYKWTITSFGIPLIVPPKTFDISIFFSGVISACGRYIHCPTHPACFPCAGSCPSVQGFFSFRIYTLSRTLFIPIVSWILSFLRLVVGTAVFITAFRMTALPIFEAQFGWLITTAASIGVGNDLLITVTLVLVLQKQRGEVQARTIPLVDRLIVWTMETGLMTTVASLATLICFLTMKGNLIWGGVFVVVSRLYSNSVLASLNSRATLRSMNTGYPSAALSSTMRSQISAQPIKMRPLGKETLVMGDEGDA